MQLGYKKILEKWVSLRFLTCRKILGFQATRNSQLSVQKYLHRCLELSHKQGSFFYQLDGDQLKFVMAGFCYYDSHLKSNVNRILFDCAPSTNIAEELQQYLPRLSRNYLGDFSLEILEPYAFAIPIFKAQGLGIKAQQFGGYTSISDRLLLKKPSLQACQSLAMKQLKTEEHIEKVWEWKRRSFDKQPELAWYWDSGGSKEDLEICLLKETLEEGRAFCVEIDGVPIGYLGYKLSDSNHSWPRYANVDMIVDSEWRGKGLLWSLYRQLFEALRCQKVAYYRGISSNPAVLHYANKLLRPRISHLMAPMNSCPEQRRFTF